MGGHGFVAVALVAGCAFALSQGHANAQATLTPLGFLDLTDTYHYSGAYGVSADGATVVGISQNSGGSQEAFRWNTGVKTGLGFLPGGNFSIAYGVNADGSVVVGYGDNYEAFRWSGSTMTGLGFLPGGTWSIANAVNADGSVVVGRAQSPAVPFGQEAFRWVVSGAGPTGTMTGLGVLPGEGTATPQG